jgi:hypothetical protein
MFERGSDFERGLRPLSYIHPSPASNNFGFLSVSGWRGAWGEASSRQPNANKTTFTAPIFWVKIDEI